MRSLWIALSCMAVTAVAGMAAAAPPDQAGCTDHPLFPSRMPEYRIESCKVEDYGVYEFWATKGPKTSVEGKFTFITYAFTGQRANEPNGLAVVRNYENAIQKVGGTILQTQPNWWVNAKIAKDGQEAWVQVEKGNGKIWLRVVEKKAMEQYIVADAAAFSKDIKSAGHAAVYGITFDTDKAEIKPESAQALGEIAKLLKSDPGLKVAVVGHTDTTGPVSHNLTLSQERAQSVMQSLIREHGIDAGRLEAYGCGPYAPVASNDTEEGRGKNRRVELVKR